MPIARTILRILCCCVLTVVCLLHGELHAQYLGGNGSGITATTAITLQTGIADTLYNGGNEDGIAVKTAAAQNIGLSDSIYNGGLADGFSIDTTLSRPIGLTDSLYNGGVGQGFSSMLTIFRTIGITDSLYNGGAGKGDLLYLAPTINLGTCTGDTLIWNGSVNIVWGNPNNWDCGVVPGTNSNVIIPSGRVRYPTLFISAEIRSLRLQPGSAVNIGGGAMLKLNGQ